MRDDDEPFDLDEWPECREAHDAAYRLARDAAKESGLGGENRWGHRAAIELEKLRRAIRTRSLAPEQRARLLRAHEMGEAAGRADAGEVRREAGPTCFPSH